MFATGLTAGRVAVMGMLAALLLVACGDDEGAEGGEGSPTALECELGADRGEGSQTAVLLSCAALEDGRSIELLAVRPGGGAGPCLYVSGVGQGQLRGCGRAPLERVPPQAGAILVDGTAQPTPGGKIEIYGGLSAEVEAVQLWFGIEDSGAARQAEATVVQVDSAEALDRAGVESPFGYFAGEIAPRSERCVAVALDSDGEPIGADRCDPFGGLAPDAFIAGAEFDSDR